MNYSFVLTSDQRIGYGIYGMLILVIILAICLWMRLSHAGFTIANKILAILVLVILTIGSLISFNNALVYIVVAIALLSASFLIGKSESVGESQTK